MRFRNGIAASVAVLKLAWSAPPEPATMDHGAGTMHRVSEALGAIVPEDYVIDKLPGDMVFTEEQVWIKGNTPQLLFSDIPPNVIYRWAEGDAADPVFYDQTYRGEPLEAFLGSHGLILDAEGRLRPRGRVCTGSSCWRRARCPPTWPGDPLAWALAPKRRGRPVLGDLPL
ncbi:MAG: hypothetical protein OXN96_22865 [Bryobacterales bacterium]|nr:hypothetical protein [Bryobacterales bacterium]MDE0623212.1 hypothetical protein [Bryobacterales bacterium]